MTYILYFGHVNIDVMLKVENFGNLGESREVKEYESRVGGTAYNAYKSLIALGVPTKIFSVVGPEIENLDGYFVRDKRNPTCWIITNGEEQMAYIYQGLWKNLHKMKVYIPIDEFEWLHFSTGNPEFYIKIAKKAKVMGKKISFDPSQEIHYVYNERKFTDMLSLADIFFCNEREYEKALQFSGEKLFNKIIVRTEGNRGASLYYPHKGWKHFNGISVKAIDTTGAGDTFRAAFYAALYRGHTLEEAIKYGNLAAAKVVMSKESFYTGTWEELKEK